MKMKVLYMLVSIVLTTTISCFGQEDKDSIPVVGISKLTGSPTKLLPFDREFYLKIPKTEEFELHQVFVHKLKKNQLKDFKKGDRKKLRKSGYKRWERKRLLKFQYRNPKTNFLPVERRRIELTYGAGNYHEMNRTLGSGQVLTIDLDFKTTHSSRLLGAQQIMQRKSNVVEKENYVLVKVFPLLSGQFYSFSYVLKSKNEQINKLIDKTVAVYTGGNKSKDAVAKNIYSFDAESLERNARIPNKYLKDLLKQVKTEVQRDIGKGLIWYETLAKDLPKSVCLNVTLKVINLDSLLKKPEYASLASKQKSFGFKASDHKVLFDAINDKIEDQFERINDVLDIDPTSRLCLIRSLVRNGKTKEALPVLIDYDKTFGEKGLTKQLVDIKAKKKTIEEKNELPNRYDLQLAYLTNFLKCYEKHLDLINSCDTCYSSLRTLEQDCEDSCQQTIPFSLRQHPQEVLYGNLPIYYRSLTEIVPNDNYSLRKKNLMGTASFIEKVSLVNYHSDFAECQCSYELLDAVYGRIKAISEYEKARAKLLKDMNAYNHKGIPLLNEYSAASIMGSSAGSTTLKTKSKFTVRPDFGVAYYTNFSYNNDRKNLFDGVVPFFGVRFNLTPINPDIAYRRIRYKTFWHRSSISVAYSPISVSDGETRYNVYEGMNFLLGYGFRFTNAINLTVGGLMFRKEHEDPFVSKKELAVAPYMALSVDFDIVDVISDLKALFIK